MTTPDRWRKPSRCGDNACVEIFPGELAVGIRSTLNPELMLWVTRDEWAAFRDAMKAGEYEDV